MKCGFFLIILYLNLFGLSAWGQRSVSDFDRDWRFARFGLQADGSRLPEPFRIDLDGYTGKLPWQGISWYRKHFEVSSKDKKKRFYLDFDGTMANAEVWLNGKKVGGRPFGYSSFRVDLTPYVLYGTDNVVAVRLDTEKFGSRWYPGAGMFVW